VAQLYSLGGSDGGAHVSIEGDGGQPVQARRDEVKEVLMNLLENALKYSPAESTIQIQARTTDDPPALEVRVRDQGIGIPPHELGAIFDKFYRVQHIQLPWAPSRPPIGTGLGLAICAAIVRAHGGEIWAESTPGTGSTFVFTLPMTESVPQGHLPDLETSAPDTAERNAAPPPAATGASV
jgi:signal transduction histidine kinase